MKGKDVAELMLSLLAQNNGADSQYVYTILAKQPGSTMFTAEEGRDALLVAVAHFVMQLADFRRAVALGNRTLALARMQEGANQLGRIATLASFIERSVQEAQKAYSENRPVGPMNPFNAPGGKE